jgi:hypothetical protein
MLLQKCSKGLPAPAASARITIGAGAGLSAAKAGQAPIATKTVTANPKIFPPIHQLLELHY